MASTSNLLQDKTAQLQQLQGEYSDELAGLANRSRIQAIQNELDDVNADIERMKSSLPPELVAETEARIAAREKADSAKAAIPPVVPPATEVQTNLSSLGTVTSTLTDQATQSLNAELSSIQLPNPIAGLGTAITNKVSEVVDKAKQTFGAISDTFSQLTAKKVPSVTSIAPVLKPELYNAKNISFGEDPSSNLTASGTKSLEPNDPSRTDYLVSLTEVKDKTQYVVFEVMPDIQEQRQVQYETVAPPQFPGAFQKYRGTDSVQWTIQAKLVARNSKEASMNLLYISRLRGWTMPFFGQKTPESLLGAPPPVLTLRGYSKHLVGPIPVVLTGLSWSWPKEVDYVQAINPEAFKGMLGKSIEEIDSIITANSDLVPFPAVMDISISLVESLSTSQFNNFDLVAYYNGDMVNAYEVPIPKPIDSPQSSTAGKFNPADRVGTEKGRGTNLLNIQPAQNSLDRIGSAIGSANQRVQAVQNSLNRVGAAIGTANNAVSELKTAAATAKQAAITSVKSSAKDAVKKIIK